MEELKIDNQKEEQQRKISDYKTLWKNRDFMMLWSGQTMSEFGSRITRTGLPIVELQALNVGARQMGIIAALGALPSVVFGLFAGVFLDRFRRKPLMIAVDILRCLILLSIPIAFYFNSLSLAQLCIVTVLVAICSVCFSVAYKSYLPSLVPKQLMQANSKLSLSNSIAEITGPGIAGILIQTISAPFAIIADSFTFVISSISLLLIKKKEILPKQVDIGLIEKEQLKLNSELNANEDKISEIKIDNISSILSEIKIGLKFIFNNNILKFSAFAASGLFFFFGFFGALYSLYAIRILKLNMFELGIIISIGGISSLVGSLLTEKVTQGLGVGKVILSCTFLIACSMLCIPLAGLGGKTLSIIMLSVSQLGDCFLVAYFINDGTIRQTITPPNMLGRMNAGMQLFETGLAPIGALLGGFLAESIGVQNTMYFCSVGGLFAFFVLLVSPIRKIKKLEDISLA